MPVFRFAQLVVERDGDRTRAHRAQPGGRELRRVAHEEQDAVARTHAERCQRRTRAGHARRQLGKRQRLVAADQRGARAVALKRGSAQQEFCGIHLEDGGASLVSAKRPATAAV